MYGEKTKKKKQGFTYKQIGLYGTDVKVSICSESSLTDQCVAFGAFLRACGYHFDGEVDIVQDEQDSPSPEPEYDEDNHVDAVRYGVPGPKVERSIQEAFENATKDYPKKKKKAKS